MRRDAVEKCGACLNPHWNPISVMDRLRIDNPAMHAVKAIAMPEERQRGLAELPFDLRFP
jgi:hypothetical protein